MFEPLKLYCKWEFTHKGKKITRDCAVLIIPFGKGFLSGEINGHKSQFPLEEMADKYCGIAIRFKIILTAHGHPGSEKVGYAISNLRF